MIKRVALVGASSTGKTTVYELLKGKLPKFEFVNESTRTVGSYGFPINEFGTDATQLAISSFHLEALLKPGNAIFDRGYLDLLVYTNYMDVSNSTSEPGLIPSLEVAAELPEHSQEGNSLEKNYPDLLEKNIGD